MNVRRNPDPSSAWLPVSFAVVLVAAAAVLFIAENLPVDNDWFGFKQADSGMEERYDFEAEWFDSTMDLRRKFSVTFFPKDNSVEMHDLKLKRIFLKRIRCETVQLKDFHIGNTVIIFSRPLLITDYVNSSTKSSLGAEHESTFAMIKPDAMEKLGRVLESIHAAGFTVAKARMVQLTSHQAGEFYHEHQGRNFFGELLNFMTSGPVLAMELVGKSAVTRWRETLGPTDSALARQSAPESIRALYGRDTTYNAAHGSDSEEAAQRELSFFFPSSSSRGASSLSLPRTSARLQKTTCCLIKPHAVKAGLSGAIVREIQDNGFRITAAQTFHLTVGQAQEFYEIYKGVVDDYTGMVKQLSSGRSLVMEVGHDAFGAEETVARFREIIGPADPKLASTLFPASIRAKYGESREENAVHCTDLPEDGPLECEFFFKILQ